MRANSKDTATAAAASADVGGWRALPAWRWLWQPAAASGRVPESMSLYLDLVRWGAAMLVVLYHLKEREFGTAWLNAHLPGNGHAYVTIFFVLSGFVIAATMDRKQGLGPREYALDRASRLYSVALPVLLICTAMAIWWPASAVDSAYEVARSYPLLTLAANALFLGNAWYFDAAPYLNGPYWSLCYEAMYYVAFGVWTFSRGAMRWALLAAVALIAGPKILLLMPCWLLGVGLYRWRNRVPLSPVAALALAVAALAVPAMLHVAGAGRILKEGSALLLGDRYADFSHSVNFLGDYVTALAFSLHLAAMYWVRLPWPAWLAAAVRLGASMSFTLYLFHLPVVSVAMQVLGERRASNGAVVATVLAVLLACYLLSRLTEANRPALRRLLELLLARPAEALRPRQVAAGVSLRSS
jgi:peptidoglycan/LPS O-acetylase OafA/YrhL